MEIQNREHLSLLVLLCTVFILLLFIFIPFLTVLSLAVVFAVLLHTPYQKLVKMFRGWKSAAATMTVFLTLVFIIVPLFFLGAQIIKESQNLYSVLSTNEVQYVHIVERAIEAPVRHLSPTFTFDLNARIANTLTFISNNLGSLIYQSLYVLFGTSLMLLTLFFFLRDGQTMLTTFTAMSPFGKSATRRILSNMYETIRSVMRGTLYVVLIRWLCIWLTFFAFGIPNALLWSSAGGLIGAIPGIGTGFALIGGIAYLYLHGDFYSAIGLIVTGSLIIFFVDNLLTSYFFGKGLSIPPIFVLFSVLGGMLFFGPVGFVMGPIVVSLFISITNAYRMSDNKEGY